MDQKTQSQILFKDLCTCVMKTPLLKFGDGGKFTKPGFRFFWLDPDLTGIHWGSKKRGTGKNGGEKSVMFSDVSGIVFQQRTEKFKKNNRPDLKPYSFSLIYVDSKKKEDTLDVVAKDEKQFLQWTGVLTALVEKSISAEDLSNIKGKLRTHLENNSVDVLHSGKGHVMEDQENDLYAFGWTEWGQIGTSAEEGERTTVPKLLSDSLAKGISNVSCGWAHSLMLSSSGDIFAYGNLVGTSLTEDVVVATPIPNIADKSIISVACGAFHSIALSAHGHVYSWGCGAQGQLGHGDKADQKEPTLIEELLSTKMGLELVISQVVCGISACAALGEDGNVYTWGCGQQGVLGHNDTEDRLTPRAIKDLAGTEIRTLAAGDFHMCAVTDNDTFSWGWNGCGQLGLGHEEDQLRPHVVNELRGKQVVSVSCGASHTVVVALNVSQQGVVYSWGNNSHGQLGLGKKKRVLKPTSIPSLPNVLTVVCGAMHTCLLTEQNEVWSTGYNKNGQLGQGNTIDLDQFTVIEAFNTSAGKQVRLVACGGQHTCVLTKKSWIKDDEATDCMLCKITFTVVNRRHHCRNCMGIFCGKCSNKKMAILRSGSTKPQRACLTCYADYIGQ